MNQSDKLDAIENEIRRFNADLGIGPFDVLSAIVTILNNGDNETGALLLMRDAPLAEGVTLATLRAALAEAAPWLESALADEPDDYDNHELRATVDTVRAALEQS
jgi:hypothetical protein